MTLATAYTEDTLADFLHAELGDVATLLGWNATTGTGSYQHAVNATLRAYGVGTIASATDMDKLETLARWQAWDAAVSALTTRYDVNIGGQSMSRSQMATAAERRLKAAAQQAVRYRSDLAVTSTATRYRGDIYAPITVDSEFG